MLSSLQTTVTIKKQLEQINVISVYPLVGFNDEQIRQYLDVPPQSVNPILWEQAKRNNPNPKKLLPVPIVGFKGIDNFEVLIFMFTVAGSLFLFTVTLDLSSVELNILATPECERLR